MRGDPGMPAEVAIADAIKQLDAGGFQLLAEGFARLLDPLHYGNLVGTGRNVAGRTIRGWPDGWSGTYAFEATHAANWRAHHRADLAEARKRERPVEGFLFVASARAPADRGTEEQAALATAMGVPLDQVRFIFGDDLVARLRAPRYALLVAEHLGLRINPFPFQSIERASVFGLGPGLVPTRDDFDKGRVGTSATQRKLQAHLDAGGFALLQGRQGSGKTTAATALGIASAASGPPAYYVDLAADDVSGEGLFEILTTRSDEGVLFIVDNGHRRADLALRIFHHWSDVATGSRLLLIERSRSGAQAGLAAHTDLRAHRVRHRPEADDFRAAYARVAGAGAVQPSTDNIEEWHQTFGDDLAAFGSAVLGRRHPRDVTFTAADAREYVARTHFAPANLAERRALLRLALVATYELELSFRCFEPGILDRFVTEGAVAERDVDGDRRFRLSHPSVAALLLAAAERYPELAAATQDPIREFVDIITTAPIVGATILRRLSLSSPPLASAVQERLWNDPRTRDQVLEAAPVAIGFLLFPRSKRYELDALLATRAEELASRLLADDTQNVSLALHHVYTKLPLTAAGIAQWLEAHGSQLSERVLRMPLEQVPRLLATLRQMSEGVTEDLESALLSSPDRVASAVTAGSLLAFVKLLDRFKDHNPRAYDTFLHALTRPALAAHVASALQRASLSVARETLRHPAIAAALQLLPTELLLASSSYPDSEEVVALANALVRAGRHDLARNLVAYTARQYTALQPVDPLMSLTELTHLLRILSPQEPTLRADLVRRLGGEWLTREYQGRREAQIAAALHSVRLHQEASLWPAFVLPSLAERIESAVPRLAQLSAGEVVGLVQLYGAARALGIPPLRFALTATDLNASLGSRPHHRTEIDMAELRIWIGLRALVRDHGPRQIDPRIGEDVLRRWVWPAPPTARYAAWFAWMRSWLASMSPAWRLSDPDNGRFAPPEEET